jgi:hypothetical protein
MKEPEGYTFTEAIPSTKSKPEGSRKIISSPRKSRKKSPVKKKTEEPEEKKPVSKDENHDAIDMRKEDAELEKILRDYNNEVRAKKSKKELERPFDLPYYKNVQIPEHLKWVSLYSRANEVTLM